jgi:hypothetical protein
MNKKVLVEGAPHGTLQAYAAWCCGCPSCYQKWDFEFYRNTAYRLPYMANAEEAKGITNVRLLQAKIKAATAEFHWKVTYYGLSDKDFWYHQAADKVTVFHEASGAVAEGVVRTEHYARMIIYNRLMRTEKFQKWRAENIPLNRRKIIARGETVFKTWVIKERA